MNITIFTPSYNRAHTLRRLYLSLCEQTSKTFEWLIVDDGSTDETEDIINSFHECDFQIRYYKKENGGKHRAINYALSLAKGEWFFIVDSDDFLKPNAIEIVLSNIKTLPKNEDYCAIVANRVSDNNIVIGTNINYDVLDTDFLSYRTKYRIKGDRAEIIRTSILRKYPFPEIDGEKFCPENIVWYRIAQDYKARYINSNIYVCEYLSGGLTDQALFLEKMNPVSFSIYYLEYFRFSKVFRYSLIALYKFWMVYKSEYKYKYGIKPSLLMYILYPFAFLLRLIKNK